MAIVVCEESGTISIVEGGRIRRGLDGPGLKQALLASLGLAAAAPGAEAPAPAPTGEKKP